MVYLGVIASVLGLAKIHARYIGHYVLHSTDPYRLVWTLAYMAMLVIATYGAGLPDLAKTRRQAVTSSIGAPLAAAFGISFIQLLAGDALLPRFVVFGSAALLIPWNIACVAVSHSGRAQGERRDRVLVVAADGEALALRDELEARPERPAVLVASMRSEDAASDAPRIKPLCERVLADRATVVVLDRSALAEPSIVSQAASLHEAGLRVRPLRLFYGEWLGKLPMSELERASLLFDIREVHGTRYARVKRLADVAIALGGLLVFVMAVPLVAIGDVVANRGPLFYRQERIGKNGRRFQILKFRTMRPVANAILTTQWTSENDPRVTPFGRFLRKTHLDEVPQVVNILRGHLSVVGPRPEQPHYV